MEEPKPYYTYSDIRRYQEGSMDAREMHELEKAALNDPLLADAIDGFYNAEQLTTQRHLNEIHAMLQGNTEEAKIIPMPPDKRLWLRNLVAASIVGILGFSAWYFLQPGKTGRENTALVKQATKDTITNAVANAPSTLFNRDNIATNTHNLPASKNKAKVKHIGSAPLADNTLAKTKEPVITLEEKQKDFLPLNTIAKVEDKAVESTDFKEPAQHSRMMMRGTSSIEQPQKGFFAGKITDEKGQPVSGASVVSNTDAGIGTITNIDGSFKIAGTDSAIKVSLSAVGYERNMATLLQGRVAGLTMTPVKNNLEEVVVVGYGTQNKKAITGAMSRVKAVPVPPATIPGPKGGWEQFYNHLYHALGINKEKANKLLHLQFTIENGKPANFIIIKSPDAVITQKIIDYIKNTKDWISNENNKLFEIKLNI